MGRSSFHKPSSTSNQAVILKRLAAQHILVANEEEFSRYLDEHAPLGKLLPRVCAKVRQDFGEQAELALELYKDREIDDRYLTLYVRLQKYDVDIIRKIDDSTRLFDKQMEKLTGYLLITTDFRRPREKDGV